MSRSLPVRGLLGVAILGLVGLQWQQRTERRELRQLRDQVLQARVVARECTRDLAVAEGEFRDLDRRVDSLRAVVDTLESLDPRGVPAPLYEEYLGTVDVYNEGVERWETAADALRAAEEVCRARVDSYNELADSARSGPLGEAVSTP